MTQEELFMINITLLAVNGLCLVVILFQELNIKGKIKYRIKKWKKKREKPPIQQNEEEELPAWVEKFIDDYLKNH